ncbi:hypothetical protein RD110_12235 [Rhodoferax koreense]|uniref:TIR domain-containing protein n=2 Tax=Rhodoferax koreensis TaxID=1842727 RepID=A0A1P8JW13_9BURK|nr:hypothetical protein RD110_12235 [Rhodoferax koreense]
MGSFMADIFLSYNETDRAIAHRLAQALQSVGWSVWWDRRIPAGETWRGVLGRELQTMRCMVVIWSARSVQSEWVCEEAAEGRQSGKLVPVMIDAVRPPAGFREVQAADLIGWDGAADFPGLRQLVDDIARLLGRPAQAGSLPPTAPEPLPRRWKWPAAGAALLAVIAIVLAFAHWQDRRAGTQPMPASPVVETVPVPRPSDRHAGAAATPASTPTVTPAVTPAPAAETATATRVPAPTPAPAKPGGPLVKKAAGSNPRCAALLERQQLGETLPASARLFLQQEC